MADPTISEPGPRGRARRRARPILVVDDDANVREFVADVLVDAGYDVVTARDGAEALRAAEDARPALLLLDIQMPNVDGAAVARELRMRLRQIPLVVMTGLPRPEHHADRCNAVACLPKPFETEALIRLVRRYAR